MIWTIVDQELSLDQRVSHFLLLQAFGPFFLKLCLGQRKWFLQNILSQISIISWDELKWKEKINRDKKEDKKAIIVSQIWSMYFLLTFCQ